ncbi:MAG: hypothetical protein GWP61_01035 [Chloroflexi bacterium]|jgi:hypothetical protein|nr:hypothetical protein [Chloroflexota bacterium]
MNQSSLFQLFVLISLIDLQEQATPDAIFANLMKSRYLMTAVDRDAFDDALNDLLVAEHLAWSSHHPDAVEVEYSAYGLLRSLCADISLADVSPHGLERIKEVQAYADEVFEEEAEAINVPQEMGAWQTRSEIEAALLLEKKRAETFGYPYDILLQARETKQGNRKVYVVLLDNEVRNRRRVKTGTDPDLPTVYVGMTSLSIEARFQNHKNNHQAGRGYVRDYGLRLLPTLYEAYNPMPYKLAQQAEAALAEKLRLEGYTVLGGH